LYAVITSGGAEVDVLWPATGRDAITAMRRAVAADERTRVIMP
jgi:hypothetical protein